MVALTAQGEGTCISHVIDADGEAETEGFAQHTLWAHSSQFPLIMLKEHDRFCLVRGLGVNILGHPWVCSDCALAGPKPAGFSQYKACGSSPNCPHLIVVLV